MPRNDDIGYGKPPRASQWKPGESGNPHGRPKARHKIFSDAASVLSAPVSIKSRMGRRTDINPLEAGFLKLCIKALKNDRGALHQALKIILEYLPPALQVQRKSEPNGVDAKMKLAKIMGLTINEHGIAVPSEGEHDDDCDVED
ncbi:DUF5681 domain-containing protein [Hyphomonas sp.]|jgi:hypothetical protein|uniref:DUF5681 domain-containing protein n=1 Tax=Hyphomonas sp. TaxID=87 RepID=UPI0039E3333B